MTTAARNDIVNETFDTTETFARRQDELDPLRRFRELFHIPRRHDGQPVIYFCGNSLGLQPRTARALVEQEFDDWAKLAVDAHFKATRPWYSYHEIFRESGARLVGAQPDEVVMMNSLTINLHLMLVSFYQPTTSRFKVLLEDPCFPSDLYAIRTHLRTRGIDPDDALVIAKPRAGDHIIRDSDIEGILHERGDEIALVLLGGVNFFTGQVFDMARIAAAARTRGCVVGLDLAHAAGNVELALHDWDVDFAVWCSYKYLNAGPGAVAGCFVHERHARDPHLMRLQRYGGWWGNDPETRFQMHLIPEFTPRQGADGWQVSNPPILAMAPLRAALDIFDEAGMSALRAKSKRLTGYLRFLLERAGGGAFQIITPAEPEAQGCQLSILIGCDPPPPKGRGGPRQARGARGALEAVEAGGAVCDFREPNVIRVAPTPLYNTFHEVWRFANLLSGRF